MSQLSLIGECMLELRQRDGAFLLGYGGDVFNTAVYADRLGLSTSFLTATGDDHYSNYLINAWQQEGVGTQAVRIIEGATPSLYIIQTDDGGERTFHYWRDASPFRSWLAPGQYLDELPQTLASSGTTYFSGITLGLLADEAKERLFDLIKNYRAAGGKVAFDPNYRPKLWKDPNHAMYWIDQAYSYSDIAMPSLDDEAVIRNDRSQHKLIDHIHSLGTKEIVLKDGPIGATVSVEGVRELITAEKVSTVVDTTAAGDSFNGAYLASRLNGAEAATSAEQGCKLAAQVIQHQGAIISSELALT